MSKNFERRDTRFSADGRTVFVRLRINRKDFEFARSWAEFHAAADPAGTAEDHLEGYLSMALLEAREHAKWRAPPEIEALYPAVDKGLRGLPDMDDGIPF
ncbi:hypothetical protein [Sedimentitalea arenosa]|uniref:Uncharacterized protein n=1 Tax=Sedimentitalea arenosa TaxID=2798803 RepID=A0A8J7J1V1_9RHOB|nr:hypothetical protein [Arenibacterium arenosum]MBJ6371800.1 hypothetical protein [Arenibacterium arenosum]